MNNQWFSKVAVWLVIALVLFTVFKQFDRGATSGNQIGYSEFLDEVRNKRIKTVTLQENPGGGTEINATTTDDKRLRSTATFRVVKPIKPKASRDKSAETFLVGLGLKSR